MEQVVGRDQESGREEDQWLPVDIDAWRENR